MGMTIRSATTADAARVAELMTELGYATSPAQMQARLQSILADEDYTTLVACDGERIAGLIGNLRRPLYESDGRYGQIMVLVVAAAHQRRGIGRTLVRAAETMSMTRDVAVLVVTSGTQRADAHAFYEKNGYTWTGRRYKEDGGPRVSRDARPSRHPCAPQRRPEGARRRGRRPSRA